MKVIVGNTHLGTWCRAVHALTQVGDDEIHFDASDGILTLSTLNASMKNYATVLFFRNFFTSCQMNVTSDEPEKIAVPAKTILKHYPTSDVSEGYVSSEIKFNPAEDFITVTSEGKSHVSTTYKLCATESSSNIQFDGDLDSLTNLLEVNGRDLFRRLSIFNSLTERSKISMKTLRKKILFYAVVPDEKGGSKIQHTFLLENECKKYCVKTEGEVAFGFREFKIFTSFAEQQKVPVSIYFQTPNDPVIVTVKTDTFEARLCMATRIRDPFDMPGTEASGSSVGSNGRISNIASQMPGPSRDVSVEVNRRVERGTLDGQRDVTEEPAPKRPRRTDFRLEPEPLVNQDNEDDVMFVADLGVSENPVRDDRESRTSERDVVISGRVETLSSQSDAQNLMIRDEPENPVNPVANIVPLVQQEDQDMLMILMAESEVSETPFGEFFDYETFEMAVGEGFELSFEDSWSSDDYLMALELMQDQVVRPESGEEDAT